MCLITNKSVPNIAAQSIECFKLYKRVESGLALTPYEETLICNTELKGIKPFLPSNIYLNPKKIEELNSKKNRICGFKWLYTYIYVLCSRKRTQRIS